MTAFLIVALFALAASMAGIVLADCGLRGARAYCQLAVRVRNAEQLNSVIVRIEQFERSQANPVFRMRQVSRATGLRPMVRRRATALSVAA